MKRKLKFRQSKIVVPAEEIRPDDAKTLLYTYLYGVDNYKLTYKYGGAIPYADQGFYNINAKWFRTVEEMSRRLGNPFLNFPEPTSDEYIILNNRERYELYFSGSGGGKLCLLSISPELVNIIINSNEPIPIWFLLYWPEDVPFSHLNCLIINKMVDSQGNFNYTIDRFEPGYKFEEDCRKTASINRGLVDLLKKVLVTDRVTFNDQFDLDPERAKAFGENNITKLGPQIIEDNLVYYSGEPGGYCAMWCAAALKIYMETYRLTGKRYTFMEWMKEIYSSAEIIEEEYGLITLYCRDAKGCGIKLRTWIRNEAAKLFEDENGNVKKFVYDFICQKTLTPSNEYLLRSFLNVYYRDPQSLFNILTPTFMRTTLTKITLKYFGGVDEARNNVSTRDEEDRVLETEMLETLYSQRQFPAVGTTYVKDNVTYDAMMWVDQDIGSGGVAREVVWLIKVPISGLLGSGRYISNIGESGPGVFSSVLYLEDAKTVKQVDVGHSNALMTVKYPDNSLAFRRFDPDFGPDVKNYQMVYVDADGKWNKALARGILNVFRVRNYSNITGNAQESKGIKLFDISTNQAFFAPQTLERDLQRESGEFLGYCQIWTLRVLELAFTNGITVEQAYQTMFEGILADSGYTTNRNDNIVRIICRQYIRQQAARYVSVVIRQLFNC